MIVTARLRTRVLDGVEVIDAGVPDDKVYRVDLDTQTALRWYSERGYERLVECVVDIDRGGYLPLELLQIDRPN